MGIIDATDTTRDAVISWRIRTARLWAEKICQCAFITQTWIAFSNRFECNFDLRPNLQNVVSVKYIDSNGVSQILSEDQYYVNTVDNKLEPEYGVIWPVARKKSNSVQIEHVSGFGLASSVPQDVKDAIMWVVSHWEDYQALIEGAVRISTIPYAVIQLLNPYIDYRNRL